MAGKYFKFNSTCIIHREAVGRQAGIFKVKLTQTQNETAPWTGKPLWGQPPAM